KTIIFHILVTSFKVAPFEPKRVARSLRNSHKKPSFEIHLDFRVLQELNNKASESIDFCSNKTIYVNGSIYTANKNNRVIRIFSYISNLIYSMMEKFEGQNILDFMKAFPDDSACRAYL